MASHGKSNITMREIAEKARVAVTTVSSALNGTGRVGTKRTEKIRQIAMELGYMPNTAARILKSKKNNDMGLIICEKQQMIDGHGIFSGLIRHFMEECQRQSLRMQVELFDSFRFPDRLPDVFCGLVGGVVIGGTPSKRMLEYLAKHPEMPCVRFEEPGEYSVRLDAAEGVHMALQYLVALGHRRIGMLGCSRSYPVHNLAWDGFEAAVTEFTLDCDPEIMLEMDEKSSLAFNYVQKAEETVERLLATPRRPPTALLIAGGPLTRSFICAALKRGIRIPEDISILSCYPATWEAQNFYPALTAVEADLEEMVHVAFSILRDLMDGREVRKAQVFLSPRLFKRDTVLSLSNNDKSQR
ncbi:MAG TPA: hypothetical protein DET40_16480 [Lentisphaeria bacterium]|nr:hypothetical protein [Lentisphaeria bacterium]